jgi:hypothetical protein
MGPSGARSMVKLTSIMIFDEIWKRKAMCSAAVRTLKSCPTSTRRKVLALSTSYGECSPSPSTILELADYFSPEIGSASSHCSMQCNVTALHSVVRFPRVGGAGYRHTSRQAGHL